MRPRCLGLRPLIFLIGLCFIWGQADVHAGFRKENPNQFLSKAFDESRHGQADYAFIYLKQLLRSYPHDVKAPEAALGLSEYYAAQDNHREAYEVLEPYAQIAGKKTIRILIYVRLISSARQLGQPKKAQKNKRLLLEFLYQKHKLFLFRNHDKTIWSSPMNNLYEIIEYIDALEVKINGENIYKTKFE